VSVEFSAIKLKAEARIRNLENLSRDIDEIKENLEFMPAWCKEVASWADRTADEAGAVDESRRGFTQLEFVRLQWSDDGDLDASMANTKATLDAIRNLVGACDRLKDLVAKVQGKYVEEDGLERGSPTDDGQGLSSKK